MITPLYLRVFSSTVTMTILLVLILIVKRILVKRISARGQYAIWYVFLAILVVPFLPLQIWDRIGRLVQLYDNFKTKQWMISDFITKAQSQQQHFTNQALWKDYSVSTDNKEAVLMNIGLLVIWMMGICIFTAFILIGNHKLDKIRKSGSEINDEEIVGILKQCIERKGVKRRFLLRSSELVETPMIFGLIKPCIILPDYVARNLSKQDIYYVFIHEICHYKNKDILMNYILCIFQILYWYNPIIWYAIKKMRQEREMICDLSVIEALENKNGHISYGNAIIDCICQMSNKNLSLAVDIGGDSQQIKRRIQKIASYTEATRRLRIKSVITLLLISFITLFCAPLLSIQAAKQEQYRFREDNYELEDDGSFFEGYDGSFVLYDLKQNQYHIYNKKKSEQRVSPDSTYKIYSALFALEEHVITTEQTGLSWDGTHYSYDEWNEDHTLPSAMKYSVNWYFQTLDQATGMKKLQAYFRQIGYGNYDLSAGIKNYWMESSLKISPIEQVLLLKQFYENQWNCNPANIEAVKNAMLITKTEDAALYGKTGTGSKDGYGANGWFIGYVVKEDDVYFFALNIQDKDTASGSKAADLAIRILKSKQIF